MPGDEAPAIGDVKAADKQCFIIAPIGTEGSETRKRSNQIQKHVIDPVITPLGFGPSARADTISDGGLITQQIITNITQADLVVADLTGANPNVYYELALRHALAKPFVQLIVGEERLPFDVANQRTIFFDHRDLDSVEKAKSDLKSTVEALMVDGAVVETPLSFALDLSLLRQSTNPEERGQANIIEMLHDIRSLTMRSSRTGQVPEVVEEELALMRSVIEDMLSSGKTSAKQLSPLLGSRRPETVLWVESLIRADVQAFYAPSGQPYRRGGEPVPMGKALDDSITEIDEAGRKLYEARQRARAKARRDTHS